MGEVDIYKSSVIKRCPMCRRDYEGPMVVCSHDGTLLMQVKTETRFKKCKVCLADYESNLISCPVDDSPLVSVHFDNKNAAYCKFSQKHDALHVMHQGYSTVVLEGFDRETKSPVALKVLEVNRGDPQYERKSERFSRPVSWYPKLSHNNNIVKLLDTGFDFRGQSYLAFELVRDGLSLAKLRGKLVAESPEYFLEILVQACIGLGFAIGQQVFHQDLSPGDILIAESDDDGILIKVADFAKGGPLLHGDNKKQQLTEVGDLFGNPEFMSPEACEGKEITERSIIYSMGSIMYSALSTEKPHEGAHWAALMINKIREQKRTLVLENATEKMLAIQEIVNRCMETDPQLRFGSISELRSSLVSLKNGLPSAKYSVVRALAN